MAPTVVITGIGLITPLGDKPAEILSRIERGERATGSPPFPTHPFSCRTAAMVKNFDPTAYGLDGKSLRLMSRDAVFAAVAARLAVRDAGLKIGRDYPPERVALFGATGLSGIAFEEVSQIIKNSARPDGTFDPQKFGAVALKRILPTLSFKILTNMPICFISIFENVQGMNAVYNPWEGQAARAICAGIEAIRQGDADCALVGGCDVKTNILGFIGLEQRGLLTGNPDDDTLNVPGEGGGFLVLEDETRARDRHAQIYARCGPIRSWAEPGEGQLAIPRLSDTLPGPTLVLRSTAEHSPAGEEESTFLKAHVTPDSPILAPGKFLGSLFAAAPAVHLGLAAQALKGETMTRALIPCLGPGSAKAVFQLEIPATPLPMLPPLSISLPRRRVVITGLGVTSPIGTGQEEFWRQAAAGTSGIGPLTLFDASGLSVQIGGEVKNLDTASIHAAFPDSRPERDRKIFLALTAAREALLDAHLLDEQEQGREALRQATLHFGVSLEVFFLNDVTPYVHLNDLETAMAEALLQGPGKHPLLQTALDRAADLLGYRYGICGGRYTICSACASGAQVIGEAFRMLQSGERDVAVAGAADSMLNPLGLGGFSLLRALSTENHSPEHACRPFDVTRTGTVLGEGAAFLVLEALDHAQARGAHIYAEVAGYGSSLDAYRVSDPEPGGRGAALSMQNALRDAGLRPDQIDAVNAHGTGTPKNDAVETLAIKNVMGEHARRTPVHALKSMTGHLIGASGAVEAVAAALSFRHNLLPPTINLQNPDPDCDLDYVPGTARVFTGNTILSNSFGFGGQNATLIFRRFPA